MLPRLLAICAAIAVVAIAIPSAMPALIAYLNPDEAAVATAEAPAPVLSGETRIAADSRGRYVADAEIDGRSVSVLVDTGADSVVLTADTVRRLGLHIATADYTVTVRTANSVTRGAPVQLESVRVGNVILRGVSAVALQGDALELNLVGLSFLSRLAKFEAAGGQLVLVQ